MWGLMSLSCSDPCQDIQQPYNHKICATSPFFMRQLRHPWHNIGVEVTKDPEVMKKFNLGAIKQFIEDAIKSKACKCRLLVEFK